MISIKITSSYSVKINNYTKILRPTVNIYRKAVSFFIDVINTEWESFSSINPNGTSKYAYIREILKPFSAMERSHLEAKVPSMAFRTKCTLATLISLNKVLAASVA